MNNLRDFFPEENNKKKEKMAEKGSEDYSFERQVTPGEDELLSEIEQKQSEIQEVSSPKPKRTIKIIAEKDIVIEEKQPPNFSSSFNCYLHHPNSKYNKRKLLPVTKE